MIQTENTRPDPDHLLQQLADYVITPLEISDLAYKTAHYCLFDALGCAIAALKFPACTRLLGPIVPGTHVPIGARVPGTEYVLDPVQAAFNIGTMIRWLDYNDTWLAAEWGHPSDNLGGILAAADYVNPSLTVREILQALIKAYEIQGVLALTHSFNEIGLDHVILVKLASTALVTYLLGGTRGQIIDALSQAWIDGHSLRTYRHVPNTGPRKSWAAGDATSRAVRLSMLTLLGEPGYPSALTAPKWGFQDVIWRGRPIELSQPLGTYVIENILFKVRYPAEFHAQTAVEAAIQLHPLVMQRWNDIQQVKIWTQGAGMRIINKTGPLYNVADRDHCLQYMVAIGLIYGKLGAEDYSDLTAEDKRIDSLRACMQVEENSAYTSNYYDAQKRAIGNAVQVIFTDGTESPVVEVEYPIGHKMRRNEAWEELEEKFYQNIAGHYPAQRVEQLMNLLQDREQVLPLKIGVFLSSF
ncbi:MAG: bifunctional 2-methylcitrate dehydratase/aconitate hydratase [Gammaproteobacteria bacterium]